MLPARGTRYREPFQAPEAEPAVRRLDFAVIPFIMDLTIAMAGLLVNIRAQDLGATPLQLGLIGVAWGLPYALFCPAAGRAADRYHRGAILATGAALYGVTAVLYGVVSTPLKLILSAPIGGVGCALFWPCFETLLHTDNPKETRERVGIFNVGWTLGILAGSAAAGYFYDFVGPRAAFLAIGGAAFTDALYAAWRARGVAPPAKAADSQLETGADPRLPVAFRAGHLRIAWVANFTLWFAGSASSTIFPKLARSLAMSNGLIGLITAAVMAAQSVSFALVSRTSRWHYKLTPIVAMQIVSAAGLAVIGTGTTAIAFAAGMLLMGLGRGMSYSASLYYGLDREAAHGASTGIHEAVIGAAMVAGPLVAGAAADRVSLRTPFWLAAGLILTGVALEARMRQRLPNPRHSDGVGSREMEGGHTNRTGTA